MPEPQKNAFAVAFQKGKQAAWRNRWPGTALWLFGTAIVGGYYWLAPVREGLESIGQLKLRFGLLFSVVSTAIFGGLIPTVLKWLMDRESSHRLATVLFGNIIFWALKGVEIDLFYRLQAWAFGNDSSAATIACKVIVDQTLYAPMVGLFNCVLFYIWQDNNYSVAKAKAALGENWYVRKVLPALISNWCVWLPAAMIIYALPLALQLPVQNLILCFWVLVLVFFTTDKE